MMFILICAAVPNPNGANMRTKQVQLRTVKSRETRSALPNGARMRTQAQLRAAKSRETRSALQIMA